MKKGAPAKAVLKGPPAGRKARWGEDEQGSEADVRRSRMERTGLCEDDVGRGGRTERADIRR